MTLTVTDRGTGTHNTGATTLVPGGRTGTLAVGSMGVMCIALDNAGSVGATLIAPDTWTDAKGNVWTLRQNALFDNGAASAGIEMAIYTAPITVDLLTTDAGTMTWKTGVSPVAKAWTWYEVIPSAGKTVAYSTGGTIAGATAANAQVITASVEVGDAVIAGYFSENTAAVTGDSDSTNGSWAAQQTATVGTTTSGVRIATQPKVQTTTASTQSYDVTVSSQDRIAGYVMIHEVVNTTVTPGVLSLTTSLFAPTVTVSNNQTVVPGVLALTTSAFAPTISGSGFVQAWTNNNSGSQSGITVTVAPSAGSLLIAAIASDKSAGVYTYPGGFTPLNDDVNTSVSGAMAYKIATGSETSVVWSQSVASTNGIAAWVGEYKGFNAFDVKAETPNDESVVTSRASGTTVTTANADELAVAMMAADSATSVDLTRAWNNGFWERGWVGAGAAGPPGLSIGEKILTATGTVTTTFTTTDTGDQMYAQVATFQLLGNIVVTPGVASLTLTTFVPVVTASDHKTVTPGTASVTLTSFAPTVQLPIAVTPDTASLTTSVFAPAVSVSDNKSVVPGVAALTLTPLAPTIVTPVTVTPSTQSLAMTAFAPTVVASDHKIVTPATATLILTTYVPGVGSPIQVIPSTAFLSMTAFAPTVVLTDNKTAVPDTASLGLTAFAPDVVATDHKVVTPATASLVMTGYAPEVTATDPQLVTPDTASLILAAFAPSVTAAPAIPALRSTATTTIQVPGRVTAEID